MTAVREATRLETPLRRQHVADARVEPSRFRQRPSHLFEDGLGDVVQILTIVHGHVQRELRVEGNGAEEILEQVQVEVRNPRPPERHIEDQVWPTRDVHRRMHERLVHRQEGVSIASDAPLVAHRLLEGLAQADADVFHCVVQVHLEVAFGVHGEIHQAMLGPGLQHVVEEGNARLHLGRTAAVQVELQDDLCLLRVVLDPRLPVAWLHALPPVRSMRTAAAAPCASRPSTRLSSATWGPASVSPLAEYWITLMRLTKSSVLSAEAKRAVPPVGST